MKYIQYAEHYLIFIVFFCIQMVVFIIIIEQLSN